MKILRASWIAALTLWATHSWGGVNEWTNIGPTGADILAIEYLNGSGTALAVSPRHIYRTTNHGVSWSQVHSAGYSFPTMVAANPVNSNQAVAIFSEIFRSSDGGLTWTQVVNPAVPRQPNGTRPTSIAWTRDGSAVWIGTSAGTAYRSLDGGATWSQRSTGIAPMITNALQSMDVDATDPDHVYALAMVTPFRTSDGGGQWTMGSDFYRSWAASRTQSGIVLATTGAGDVLRSADFGMTFSPQSSFHPGTLMFAPGQNDVVYGFSFFGGISRSADQGMTWTSRTPVPGLSAIDIAISPTNPDQLMAANTSGVYASSDGGQTWTARTSGMNELFFVDLHVHNAPGAGGEAYAVAYGPEPVFRRDSTGAWVGIAANASPLLGEVSDLPHVATATADGRVYLARPGHIGVSNNGGAQWERNGDLSFVNGLAVDPFNPLNLFATDRYTTAGRSIDGGAIWLGFDSDLPTDVVQFEPSSTTAGKVYALVRNIGSSFTPMFVSTNGGVSWTPSPWNLPFNMEGAVIAHEPGSTSTVYLGMTSGLYKTTNDGGTWTRIDPFMVTGPPGTVSAIAIDPRRPSTVNVATYWTYPALRSVDGGAHWDELRVAPSEGQVYIDNIVIDPAASHRLIGSGSEGGLFELEVSPDLALSTTSAAMSAGAAGSTILTVTNNGPYAATALRLTATLPTTTGTPTVQASSGMSCAIAGVALTCDVATLRSAVSVNATVSFTPTAGGQWSATLSGGQPDPVASNNSLSVTVNAVAVNPPAGGGSGGGGGGRVDYLMVGLLGLALIARRRRGHWR
jgi:photosystem II stability/assembly factor-like uncharacterized protein